MRCFAMMLTIVCLGGCATVTSTSITKEAEGISYYLPKRLHKVSVSVSNLNEDITKLKKAEEKYAKALVVKDTAYQDYKKKEEEYKKAEEIYKNTPAGPARTRAEAERDKALAPFTISKVGLGEATAVVTDAYEAMKKITVPVAVGRTCNYLAKLTVEPQPLIPDSRLGFVANLSHNPFHSDEFKLTTTDAGLLSSTESKSTDNTGDILAKITQAIASFGVSIPGLVPQEFQISTAVPPEEKCLESLEMSEIVDLSKPADIEKLNKSLKIADLTLVIYDPSVSGSLNEPCLPDKNVPHEGLFYRRELPYLIKLLDIKANAVRADALVMMPNLSPITKLTFDPAVFVTNTQKVGFNNGMLVSLEKTRPSEAMGLVSIPADIAKTYLSTVTQIIKLKVDYTNNETDLAKSQAALLDALKTLSDKKSSQPSSGN